MYKPSMRVEGACASGGLAFASAIGLSEKDINLWSVQKYRLQNLPEQVELLESVSLSPSTFIG